MDKKIDVQQLIKKMTFKEPKTIAVAGADDAAVLTAVAKAKEHNIANAVFCGDGERIHKVAETCKIDITPFEIVSVSSEEAPAKAVELVREGQADILMKGLMQTSALLSAVLNKETGLRTGRILSHVTVLHAASMGRPVLLTDSAMIMYPDLMTKARIIENAIPVANGLGIEIPKVAPIAAVEVVNPDMPATMDAALLTAMNNRGQLKNCIVDGPLSLDLAISEDAVRHKGIDSPVAGKADILLMPNIEAANIAVKVFTQVAGSLACGIVMGASAPILLTSRSDSVENKLYSIAFAVEMVGKI